MPRCLIQFVLAGIPVLNEEPRLTMALAGQSPRCAIRYDMLIGWEVASSESWAKAVRVMFIQLVLKVYGRRPRVQL